MKELEKILVILVLGLAGVLLLGSGSSGAGTFCILIAFAYLGVFNGIGSNYRKGKEEKRRETEAEQLISEQRKKEREELERIKKDKQEVEWKKKQERLREEICNLTLTLTMEEFRKMTDTTLEIISYPDVYFFNQKWGKFNEYSILDGIVWAQPMVINTETCWTDFDRYRNRYPYAKIIEE